MEKPYDEKSLFYYIFERWIAMELFENLFTKVVIWALTTIAWLSAWRSFFVGLPVLVIMFCVGTCIGVFCERLRIDYMEGDF